MTKFIFNIVSVAPIVVLLLLAGCGAPEKTVEKETIVTKTEIALVSPTQGKLISSIRIPGELQAFEQVDLYAKVNSFVNQLMVDVGSEVQKGQLLAVLDAPELKSQQNAAASRLQAQQAIYIASKATYDRLLETSKTAGTISANELQQANAKQQADSAQLEVIKASQREISDIQDYLQIKAPFSGIITARNVSIGAFVGTSGAGAQSPIFTLVEQRKLRLVVSVPEAYTVHLDKQGVIKFMIASLPKDTLTAKISRTAGILDNRLRSERIEIDVPNNDRKLLPGMVAAIIIPLQSEENALIVPSTAILNSTLGTFVIRVRDKKAEWIPIKLGIVANGTTEVIGELSIADKIVQKASEEIRNGSTLN